MNSAEAVGVKEGYIRWSEWMTRTFHKWEIIHPFGRTDKLQFRQVVFDPKQYDRAEDQYADVCDFINGCRFAEMEYYVFCDDQLVIGF